MCVCGGNKADVRYGAKLHVKKVGETNILNRGAKSVVKGSAKLDVKEVGEIK